MKTHLKTWCAAIPATLAVAALCMTARADFVGGTFTNGTIFPTAWDQWNGQNFFYSAVVYNNDLSQQAYVPQFANPNTSFGYTRNAQYSLVGQTFQAPQQHYKLQAISILMAGAAAGNAVMYLADVTPMFYSDDSVVPTNQNSYYDIPASLLGNGKGLTYTNGGAAANTTNQWIFTLSNGTNGNDADIVIGDGHFYTLELWAPRGNQGVVNWYRTGATGNEPSGVGMMGGGEYSTRRSISRSGNGGFPRNQALALFGTTTSDPISTTTNIPPGLTNFFVDTFLSSAYSGGQITNIWTNWFGDAVSYPSGLSWSSSDSTGKGNSGSLVISANFGTGNNQYTVMNGFGGTNNANGMYPPLNATNMVRFQADLRYGLGSGITVNGTKTNYGHLQFGSESNFAGQIYFPGAVEVPVGDTNWRTAILPFDVAVVDTNVPGLLWNVLVHNFGNWYSGTPMSGASTMYLDNVRFVGLSQPIAAPPTLGGFWSAVPGLRFFTPDTSGNSRENIGTFYANWSWIDQVQGSYPFKYAFTITNFPPTNSGNFEFHMWFIPTNYLRTDYGGNPYANPFADNDTTNVIAVRVQPTGSNYLGSFVYKVNLAPGFPNITLGTLLSTKAVGTWAATFINSTNITLSGPGGISTNFNMPPADAAKFANPLVVIFGAIGNTAPGAAADISRIDMGDQQPYDNFSIDYSLETLSTWTMDAANPDCIWMTGPTPKYWVRWTTPDFGYVLLESTNATTWRTPEFYQSAPLHEQKTIGSYRYALLLTNHVPVGQLGKLYFGAGH